MYIDLFKVSFDTLGAEMDVVMLSANLLYLARPYCMLS